MNDSANDRVLVQGLERLGNDAQLRWTNIRELLGSLTAAELRDLKSILEPVDFKTDIFSKLPLELQLLIAGNVGSDDIFNYISVSRTWRQIWLSGAFMKQLSSTAFPGLLDKAAQGDELSQTDAFRRQRYLFIQVARKFHRRSQGIIRSVVGHSFMLQDDKFFTLDPALHPDQSYSSIMTSRNFPDSCGVYTVLYRNGKLAWQSDTHRPPDDSLIVVDDLHKRHRRIYRNEGILLHGRPQSVLAALGDEIVVAKADRTV